MRMVLVAAVLVLLIVDSAQACPVSPRANGSGYAPPGNARSLPKAAGPAILHKELPLSPQLENTRNWRARPILISGASAYRRGEFVYQDFLYDDRALAYPGGPGNAADIVEVRIEPLATATAIRVTLNSMADPEAVAVTIGLGGGGEPRPMPHDAGATMPADVFVTAHGCSGDIEGAEGTPTVTTDLRRRQLHILVPYTAFDPRGRTVRVGAAAGLWDGAKYLRPDPEKPAFFNVAFREPGPWTANTWMDVSQRAALEAGDLSPLHAMVNFTKLALRMKDNSDVPRTGPMNRILVSRFEAVQGRGNSDGGDFIAGRHHCDPPDCTYQYSGRLQPYSVYVPDRPRPARGYGLVVNLHGAGSNHNHFEYGSTEAPPAVWQMLAEEGHPSIMAAPNARGTTYCYFGMAGADVFEVWADVAARYRLDPRHALLTGSSMGGFGTYKLSSQFPDLFGAIFPNIGPEICAVSQAADVVTGGESGDTPVQRMFASLRNVPVLATTGLNDPLVNAALINHTVGIFDGLGYRYDFWRFQGPDDNGHAEYRQFVREFYGALDTTVRRNPRRVTYVLNAAMSDPRYGLTADHAYWVSGLRSAGGRYAKVDVTSQAIPAPTYELTGVEAATGQSINRSNAYTRQTRKWLPGAPEPLAPAFGLNAENLKAATLDVRRMRLRRSFEGTVDADTELVLRLRGRFRRGTTASVDGEPVRVRRRGITFTLPGGTSRLRVTR